MKQNILKGVPLNGIIVTALVVFIFQAVMGMYYNNNALMFPDIEAFNSFNKAAAVADLDFAKAFGDLPSKKWSDGFLYQVILAPVIKLAGKSNLISVVFIFDLFMFAGLLFLFYSVAVDYTGRELSFITMLLFGLSPPVMLAAFSGAGTALTILLSAAAFYHAYFSIPRKKFRGIIVFSSLMLLNGWISAVFGAAFLVYALLKAREKESKKNMPAIFLWSLGIYALFACAVFIYVFISNFSIEYLRGNGLLDVKTWTVDSLFKDGFLWSKSVPVFFTVFFYIAFFTGISGEIKEKVTGIMTLTSFLATAALLAGFFSTFEPQAKSYLFVTPFYFCMYLSGIKGLNDFSGYMEMKKNPYFSAHNILYGFVMFFVLYSVIMAFNRTVEADNLIQYITGDNSVVKYLER